MYENEIEEASLKCNKLAMDYLRADKFKESLALLQRAESLLTSEDSIPNRLRLLGITYNNLGCFYKKKKHPTMALKYLKESLSIETQIESDSINLASGHLNISAILSMSGKHQKAYNHARQALALLEIYPDYNPNLITNLVISYYNCGVEAEYLQLKQEALKYFQHGLQISGKELGPSHYLTQSLEIAVKKISEQVKHERVFRETSHRGYKSIGEIKERLPNISTVRTRKSLSYARSNRLNRGIRPYL